MKKPYEKPFIKRQVGGVTNKFGGVSQTRVQESIEGKRVKDLVAMIREIVGPDVQVEFQPVDPELEQAGRSPHYTITPYSFRPRIAKKLVANPHVDMGQGIIDLLEALSTEPVNENR